MGWMPGARPAARAPLACGPHMPHIYMHRYPYTGPLMYRMERGGAPSSPCACVRAGGSGGVPITTAGAAGWGAGLAPWMRHAPACAPALACACGHGAPRSRSAAPAPAKAPRGSRGPPPVLGNGDAGLPSECKCAVAASPQLYS